MRRRKKGSDVRDSALGVPSPGSMVVDGFPWIAGSGGRQRGVRQRDCLIETLEVLLQKDFHQSGYIQMLIFSPFPIPNGSTT